MDDKERLEEIKKHRNDADNSTDEYEFEKINFYNLHVDWLIEQAERVQELEKRIKELEYASKYNGKLNEFLQKRKLPPNTLGRHVVEVVMDYVEELEQQNKRYRKTLEEIRNYGTSELNNALKTGYAWIAHEALEGKK